MVQLTLFMGIAIGFLGFADCNSRMADEAPQSRIAAQSHTAAPQREVSTHLRDTMFRISRHIVCIFQDKAGNIWFGTDGDGACRYDGTSFVFLTKKEGLCSDFVRTITQDHAGNIWFSTSDGICRYNGTSFTNFTDTEKLGYDSYLGDISRGGFENLWFGANGGAYRYDGRFFTYFPLPEIGTTSSLLPGPHPTTHSLYSVYSILEDRSGNIWFGTENRGVCRYDGKSLTWFTGKGLDKAAVRCLFQDRVGNIWFGNNGAGVFRYNGKSLINFTDEKGLTNDLFLKSRAVKNTPGTLGRIWSIAEDNAGNIWFGTIDAGAWRYDGTSLTNFTVSDGLTSNAITTIYKDRTGHLWFGTYGGGVCRYDGKSFVKF